MSRVKAEVRSYFATPVVLARLEDHGRINAELRAAILERSSSEPGVQHSNLGGWQSDWDLEAWGGEAARTLLDAARNLATRMTSDRAGKPVKVAWKTIAWANVNRRGHGNEFHTHPGAYWSGTYYVDDGDVRAVARLRGAGRPVGRRERADLPAERPVPPVPVLAAARRPALSRRPDADLGGVQFQRLSAAGRPIRSGSSATAP